MRTLGKPTLEQEKAVRSPPREGEGADCRPHSLSPCSAGWRGEGRQFGSKDESRKKGSVEGRCSKNFLFSYSTVI